MERHELEELHYITPIANVPSILRRGILSHHRVKDIDHESVAMDEIQARRAKVTVPSGRKLHEYANLYFCARNPMMYKRRAQHQDLCVLRINPDIIDLKNVVITDGNASSDYVRFFAAPKGLAIVDKDWTFAENWTDPDPIQYFRKKAAKCAEVLVPDFINPEYILGAYISCQEAKDKFQELETTISVIIDSHLFFR
jgi:acetyltransferase-like isoleucine patch superfamily enzyme